MPVFLLIIDGIIPVGFILNAIQAHPTWFTREIVKDVGAFVVMLVEDKVRDSMRSLLSIKIDNWDQNMNKLIHFDNP